MPTYKILEATGSKLPAGTKSPLVWLQSLLDISLVNDGAGMAAADVVQLVHIPAGAVVFGVHVEVLAADVSALADDIDIGDATDADGFHDGLDATAAVDVYNGVGKGGVTPVGYDRGKYYAAADTIDLTLNTVGGAVDGKIFVQVLAMMPADRVAEVVTPVAA